jgi:hypothetical protein
MLPSEKQIWKGRAQCLMNVSIAGHHLAIITAFGHM